MIYLQQLSNQFKNRRDGYSPKKLKPIDIRPWHQRIAEDIEDKVQPRDDLKEFLELRNLIESTHFIDDVFQERDIDFAFNPQKKQQLIKQMKNTTGKKSLKTVERDTNTPLKNADIY